MSTDTSKLHAKLSKLNKSLDELESQLEPLFSQSLPETLLALDTIQQAKLQVIIPYVVYDLVFVYLKSRGIDPKTHRVVAELERVRGYFDKIKHAEEAHQKRKSGIDKGAAERFIKHAIAQAKNAQLVDEPSDAPPVASSSATHERVPVKVTSKMMARAEYQKQLEELGSEEEDGLEVFNEEAADANEGIDSPPQDESTKLDKGKGRAPEENPSSSYKRPRGDTLPGHGNSSKLTNHKKPKLVQSLSSNNGMSMSIVEDRSKGKAAKKAKYKAKKVGSS